MNPSKHEDSLGRLAPRPASPTTHSRLSRRIQLSAVLVAGVAALAAVSEPTALVARAEQQQRMPSSLAQAIRNAERETGGRARKVEMERERGIEVYEIKTVSQERSSTVLVDLSSGRVLGVDGPGFFSSIGNIFEREGQREDETEFARLAAVSMTLADAVDAAEKETGGRAVEASVWSQYGSTLFQVRVVRNFIAESVVVDPSTGKIVTVPRKGDRDRH